MVGQSPLVNKLRELARNLWWVWQPNVIALFRELEALQKLRCVGVSLVEFGEKVDRFRDAEFIGKICLLEDRADFFLEAIAGLLRIEATDAHRAPIRQSKAFEHFNGAGLAGAVWAEKAEDFTFLDGEAYAANGVDGTVTLVKVLNFYDWRGQE